jgi:hypothetical protein
MDELEDEDQEDHEDQEEEDEMCPIDCLHDTNVCDFDHTMEQVRAWETSKHAKSGSKTASGSDKTICCRDCSNNFLHKVTDQAFFASHGWQDPTRCKLCREKKKGVAPKPVVSKGVPMLAGGGGGEKH